MQCLFTAVGFWICLLLWVILIVYQLDKFIAQSAGAVEYTDFISAEG